MHLYTPTNSIPTGHTQYIIYMAVVNAISRSNYTHYYFSAKQILELPEVRKLWITNRGVSKKSITTYLCKMAKKGYFTTISTK